jgi:hypothetical protein
MRITLSEHLRKLCVEIGARPIGSPANQRAADYLSEVFHSLGLDVDEQAYACTGWDCQAAELVIGDEVQVVEANAFSPACRVVAPIVGAATLDELSAADLTGKIVVLHGDLANAPLSPKSWFLKSERDDAVITLLEEKHPAALIAAPPPTPQYEQLTCDWELEIPAASAPPDVINRLLGWQGQVGLTLECKKYPTTARNIVARKRAARSGDSLPKKVTLMAHFDTRINTPGALDNGAGIAVLLGLAESLVGLSLPFDLEFVAFNGEEYLPIGDDEYVRRAGEDSFGNILLAVNMDGVGYVCGDNTIASFNLTPELEASIRKVTQRFPALQRVEPWPESNHSTFAFRGVPTLALSSHDAWQAAHYPTDTLDLVDVNKLAEVVEVVRQIVLGSDTP